MHTIFTSLPVKMERPIANRSAIRDAFSIATGSESLIWLKDIVMSRFLRPRSSIGPRDFLIDTCEWNHSPRPQRTDGATELNWKVAAGRRGRKVGVEGKKVKEEGNMGGSRKVKEQRKRKKEVVSIETSSRQFLHLTSTNIWNLLQHLHLGPPLMPMAAISGSASAR